MENKKELEEGKEELELEKNELINSLSNMSQAKKN